MEMSAFHIFQTFVPTEMYRQPEEWPRAGVKNVIGNDEPSAFIRPSSIVD